MTTVITGGSGSGEDGAARADKAAALVEAFAGMELDDEARAEIMAALEACAAREQAMEAAYDKSAYQGFELAVEEDLATPFFPLPPTGREWQGTFEPPVQFDEVATAGGEAHWTLLGQEVPDWAIEPPAGDEPNR